MQSSLQIVYKFSNYIGFENRTSACGFVVLHFYSDSAYVLKKKKHRELFKSNLNDFAGPLCN